MIDGTLDGRNFISSLDPRVKLLGVTVFSVIVALEDRFLPLAYGSLLPIGAIVLGRLNPIHLMRKLLPANLFILMLWVVLPFSYPTRSEGLHHALLITIRSNLILLSTVSLLSTSPLLHLVYGLQGLKLPGKLVQLFFFSYRYIPVIHSEYLRLRNAMRVRGFKPGTNLHTYRSYANLIGMLLLRSYERSGRIYRAMLMRGFKGEFKPFRSLEFGMLDLIASLVLGFYLVGMVFVRWI